MFLDTDSCISVISRFLARRDPAKVIGAGKGTNIVGTERELREEIDKWN